MATSEGIPSSIDIEFLELNDNPYIMPFPIPKFQDIPQDRIIEIEKLSKKIIELSKGNNVKSTKILTIKIDSLIASIYGLTQNEINELC